MRTFLLLYICIFFYFFKLKFLFAIYVYISFFKKINSYLRSCQLSMLRFALAFYGTTCLGSDNYIISYLLSCQLSMLRFALASDNYIVPLLVNIYANYALRSLRSLGHASTLRVSEQIADWILG